MTTNSTLGSWQTKTARASVRSAPPRRSLDRRTPDRRSPARSVLGALRAIARFYRVNWERAAAQESEYLRIKEENLRTYWVQTGGRM
ncbi:hypothetical protein [Zhihengliuella alba]